MNSSERILLPIKHNWDLVKSLCCCHFTVKISYKHVEAEMIHGWLWLLGDIFKVFALNHTGPLVSKEIRKDNIIINLRSSIQREISVRSPVLNPLVVSRNGTEKAAACRKYFKNVCCLRKKVVKEQGQGQPVNIPSGFIFFFSPQHKYRKSGGAWWPSKSLEIGDFCFFHDWEVSP